MEELYNKVDLKNQINKITISNILLKPDNNSENAKLKPHDGNNYDNELVQCLIESSNIVPRGLSWFKLTTEKNKNFVTGIYMLHV